MTGQLYYETNDIVNGTEVVPFSILDPCILRIYRNCLNSMGKVNAEPDHIVNLPTLLTGSTLSQFSEQTTLQLPFLVCLIFVYLSKENYFAHSYFLSFNHSSIFMSVLI